MFPNLQNAAFNTTGTGWETMRAMHVSMVRLCECFRLDPEERGTPTRLAGHMGSSAQVITNWMRRGISVDGALQAERLTGRSAVWVLDGMESHRHTSHQPGMIISPSLAQHAVTQLQAQQHRAAEENRQDSYTQQAWPLPSTPPHQWAKLDHATKHRVDAVVSAMLSAPQPKEHHD